MKVGMIGIGQMGFRMAMKFLENNVNVGVYDINEKATSKLESAGAKVFSNPKTLAANYSYIITILPNVNIVKETLLKKDGLLEGFHSDSMLIEMTTSVPSITKELAKIVKKKGFRMIDAPVSGGISKAESGELTIMVGGDVKDFEEARPLFQVIGTNIVHAGGIGAGHTIKALNNLVSATTLAVTGEALALGTRLGLEPEKMLKVINSSTGRSLSSELKFPKEILPRKFDSGFTMDLMVKDLSIALNIAEEKKVPMYVAGSSYQLWKHALTEAEKQADHTALIKTIEKLMQTEIKMQ